VPWAGRTARLLLLLVAPGVALLLVVHTHQGAPLQLQQQGVRTAAARVAPAPALLLVGPQQQQLGVLRLQEPALQEQKQLWG
jgi:hypothetical protein